MNTRNRARRRWVLRVKDGDGRNRWLVMAVPEGVGKITVSIGRLRLVLEPEELSRMRAAALHAVATAVEDRGRW